MGQRGDLSQGLHPHRKRGGGELGPEGEEAEEGYREEVAEDQAVKARVRPPRTTPPRTQGSASGWVAAKPTA